MSKSRKGRPKSDKHIFNQALSNGGVYKLITPEDKLIEIINLKKFCRENNINSTHMYDVAHGKRKSHKGYRTYVEPSL